MPSYELIRLINTVLTFYYMEGLTQKEIAQRLGLSTPKVSRLLQQAREQGYVHISIRTPFQTLFELEARLKAVFGLSDAVVIPAVGDNSISLLNAIGVAAANLLLEHLRDGDVLAITPGSTVQAVANSIEAARQYKVEVVPLLGASQGNIESDMNYLATHMADRMGGKAYQLHAPSSVDTVEQAEALQSMGPVKEILDIARRANIALLGVGTLDAEVSRFFQFTALSAEDLKNLTEDCGGVGEIGAHAYNIEGQPCGKEYADRVIGLTLPEIKQIPFRIGVAGTATKALSIFAALRGGYLHALVTDEAAARGVLELFDQYFRKI
jgi:DNA-binding transcriptional regulator LsrR (DeoR family)